MPMKYLYLLAFIALSQWVYSQCKADFTYDRVGHTVTFSDNSDANDIVDVVWKFGDGSTSRKFAPSHSYESIANYEVTYTIYDDFGCSNTVVKLVELCDLNFDYQVSPMCEQESNIFSVVVRDATESIGSVDIFVDGYKANTEPLTFTEGLVNYDVTIDGDGKKHRIAVHPEGMEECNIWKDVISPDCYKDCQILDLEAIPVGTSVHTIRVEANRFSPKDAHVKLGDKVVFKWFSDGQSSTAANQSQSDAWDSGVQDFGYEMPVYLRNPGVTNYYNKTLPNMTGRITATCPDNNENLFLITFKNRKVYNEGFDLYIDGFKMNEEPYAYSTYGVTSLNMMIPGDGLNHKIMVKDRFSGCSIESTLGAIKCGSAFDCKLRLKRKQLTRCVDGYVDYEISVEALSAHTDRVALYNGADSIGEFNLTGREDKMIYSFPGDGIIDTLIAFSIDDPTCRDSLIFNQPDCFAPCSISDLKFSASGETFVFDVDRSASYSDLTVTEVGDEILLAWPDENEFLGVRIYDRDSALFYDSGLLIQGNVEEPPLLRTGLNRLEMYDAQGHVFFDTRIFVIGTNAANELTIQYSFEDISGSENGYDLFVNDEKYNDSPLAYQVTMPNEGEFTISGDDEYKTITIRDRKTLSCLLEEQVFIPNATPLDCEAELTLTPQDSCYNGDLIFMDLEFHHPSPLGSTVTLFKNDQPLSYTPFQYDQDGKVRFSEYIPADGSTYTYTYKDEIDYSCREEIIYTSPVCETPPTYESLKVEQVDATYMINNPGTPQEYYGCKDSLAYFAVSFWERYSDSEKYYVFVDERYQGTYDLVPGDTLNRIFIRLYGDSKDHVISIEDVWDLDAKVQQEFTAPRCYNPCKIVFDEIQPYTCENQIATQAIVLDSTFNADKIYVLVDGQETEYILEPDTLFFQVKADGLEHTVEVGSTKDGDEHCYDSMTFTADYCLDCHLSATANIVQDCNDADSLVYRIQINPEFKGRTEITFRGETFTINTVQQGRIFDISTLGDGHLKRMQFQSLEDPFCAYTLEFETKDCSPIICEPDFEFRFDGYEISLFDKSESSEEVKHSRWDIGGFVSFNDLDEVKYTFDSVATYSICRYIKTDSCENIKCRDITVPDPCYDFKTGFEYSMSNDTVFLHGFVNGEYNEMLFDLGDGSKYEQEDIVHIYKEAGVYDVCLFAANTSLDCYDQYCEPINVTMSSTDEVLNAMFSIYPNPYQLNSGDLIYVSSEVKITNVMLYDMNGRNVTARVESKNNEYVVSPVNHLKSGIYIVQIDSKKGVVHKKIVISN